MSDLQKLYAVGGGNWMGSGASLQITWDISLPPVKKLLLIKYGDGPTSIERITAWAGITEIEAVRITEELEEAGLVSEFERPTREEGPSARGIRKAIFERDEYACLHCGATEDLTIDHIYPKSLGGSDEIENLQTLCRSCNSRKGVRV